MDQRVRKTREQFGSKKNNRTFRKMSISPGAWSSRGKEGSDLEGTPSEMGQLHMLLWEFSVITGNTFM